METKCILVEVTEGIGVLKINRPESLNALNGEVLEEMESALVGLERDTAVKVVVVTGAGNKAFVAGGDIKEMLAMDPLAGQAFGRKGQRVMLL
ncbi:MAG: enoyl-CoA hydratase-related protein, partial [Anaerolineales bacterium]|nr:enoyl-CoA hydratase-related protein [Anaerolineales bacterium]